MNEQRQPIENVFHTTDEQQLFYRHWPAINQNSARKAIILFHRGHEHSGRLQHIVDELNLPDTDFYAWDARGHGRSPGERGYSPSLARSVQDVDEFVHFIAKENQTPLANIIVVAQSVGAVLAATWAHDYAPKIRGLILASPAFKVKLYVPCARPMLSFAQKFKGLFFVNSYVKGKYLTHDQERINSFNNDPLITRAIAVNILLDLYRTADRIIEDAAAINLPTQLLISGQDYVVHRQPQLDFYHRLRNPLKELHILPGFYHDTLGEIHREDAFIKIRSFVDALYQQSTTDFDYQHEDRWSPSADTWRELSAGPRPFSLSAFGYKSLHFAMKTLGTLSNGVKLGFETGFDSGSTLDYIYQNQPQGKNWLGQQFDKIYLHSIGWRGIRQRKINLEYMIKQAVSTLQNKDMPVRIVDIAAGHGRYVIEALSNIPAVEQILLRDYSEINVNKGRQMIADNNMTDKAHFEIGDAFNEQQLASLNPQPTLGIVSGLYELFPDNTLLHSSLAGLAAAIPAGGILLYTNQLWHPQLKTIAWSLTSHRDGEPWIMRNRSQGEMDALVSAAGFDKCTEIIDEWGIFSVSMAVRRSS